MLTVSGEALNRPPKLKQPYQFSGPEVILDIPCCYDVDIWDVGAMVNISHFHIATTIGEWRGPAQIRQFSPKKSEENLDGEDRVSFLEFMRKILKRKPG